MTKRIFAAVDISNEAKDKISEYIKNLKSEFSDLRVGWEKTEKLHLTLKFLGNIDDSDLKKLNDAAMETAGQIPKFNLQTTATGAFPSRKKRAFYGSASKIKRELYRNFPKVLK